MTFKMKKSLTRPLKGHIIKEAKDVISLENTLSS